MPTAKIALYSALFANLLIAVTKFIAAAVTRSSAMVSEGIHSAVDTSNEILLLLGMHRSRKKADAQRPFGYGKELYFWSFIVSILIFGLGGGISIYEGVTHLQHPELIKDPHWNYIVLGVALVFDGSSFVIALRTFNRQRGRTPFWMAVKKSRDPSTFVVLFEDAADVLGLLLALAGVYFGHRFNNPYLDGIASLLIGLLLTGVSLVLARESRSLLMGETASPQALEHIVRIAETSAVVKKVQEHLSMVLGPEEVMLVLRVVVRDGAFSGHVTQAVKDLKQAIQSAYPNMKRIFIEPVEERS